MEYLQLAYQLWIIFQAISVLYEFLILHQNNRQPAQNPRPGSDLVVMDVP